MKQSFTARNKKITCSVDFFYCGRHNGFDPSPSTSDWAPLPRLCGRHKWMAPITTAVLPFRRYPPSKNSLTLKTGLGVVQGHWKWRGSIDHIWYSTKYDILLVRYCNYSSILYPFLSYLTLNNVVTLKWLRGHSRSLKLVPLESFGVVSYSPSIVTMAVLYL